VSDEDDLHAALPTLVDGAASLGITLTPEQAELFVRYGAFLLERNRVMNLTAIRTAHGVMTTLCLDSLTVLLAVPTEQRQSALVICDVGAGGGFPGLPLRIVYPTWHVRLIESVAKKARFLEAAVDRLGLSGVEVIAERVEVVGTNPAYRDGADLVTARAVAPLPALIEWCAPLARPGGRLLFPKSGDLSDELRASAAAQRALNLAYDDTVPVPADLEIGEGRAIVRFTKQGPTPQRFPRRIGLAKTQPLG
jgi:16S rRNA (guanine527-N7)-methyltransferase